MVTQYAFSESWNDKFKSSKQVHESTESTEQR